MIENSVLTHEGPKQTDDACGCAAPVPEENGDRLMLFVSETCPNCAMAESVLNKAGVKYERLMAGENLDLVNEYGVNQAPTLVSVKDGKAEVIKSVSSIIGWLRK